MRKYWRLFLIIIASLSVLLMIIFRHKYENLNTVLEMMKMLSKMPEKTVPKVYFNNSIQNVINSNSWQEIFPNIYIYSTYAMAKSIISFGYANHNLEELHKISCSVWYDNSTQSIVANKYVHALSTEGNSLFFYWSCEPLLEMGMPYAVTLIKDDESVSLPINLKHFSSDAYTACLKLDPLFSDKYGILEFLIYYSNIGVRNFRIYYSSISNTVQKLLMKVAVDCGINVELLLWIPPPGFENNTLKIEPFFMDCIFNVVSYNYSKFILLLSLNKFIYLENNQSLKTLTQSLKNQPFDFWQLETFIFCSEFPSDVIAMALKIHFKMFLKNKMSLKNKIISNVIYNVNRLSDVMRKSNGFEKWLFSEIQKFELIKTSTSAIYAYEDCGQNNASEYIQNNKMWSNKNIIFKSCMYRESQDMFLVDKI